MSMARNALPLSYYEAQMVRMPLHEGEAKVVEALRVVVFGPNLPQRAIEPELLIGEAIATRTSVARDQRSIRGYFFELPADDQVIRVRYGDSQEGELRERFSRKAIRPLPKDCLGRTMIHTFQDFADSVRAHLTPEERASCVAYAVDTETPFARGTQLQLPGIVIQVPAACGLAFIDRQPTANWGHPARYLLLGYESDEFWSFEARLPPFRSDGDLRWRVIYKAPSVPDAAVAFPQ